MFSISMTTVDPSGHVVVIKDQSTFNKREARVARRATLDNSCVIVHSGVSEGDRTFDIKGTITSGQKASLEHIFDNSILVLLSCSEGLFLGAISEIDTSTQFLTMTFLVKSKEA